MRPTLKIVITSLLLNLLASPAYAAVSANDFFDALFEALASLPQPREEFLGTVMTELDKAGTITTAGIDLQNGSGEGPTVDICAYDQPSGKAFCTHDEDLAGFHWNANFADMQNLALGTKTVAILPEAKVVNVAINKWHLSTLHTEYQMVTIPDSAWVKVIYGNCAEAIRTVHTIRGYENAETGGVDVIERIDCVSPQSAHVPHR